MKAEEAKVGMRVYEHEHGIEGTITALDNEYDGCEVDFDDGEYVWIDYEDISKLEQESVDKKAYLTEKHLDMLAKEYSFNIQSDLLHRLPEEEREVWVKECEQHFKDGFKMGKEDKE